MTTLIEDGITSYSSRTIHDGLLAKFSKFALASTLFLAVPAFAQDGDPRLKAPVVQTAIAKEIVAGRRSFTGIVMARVESNLGFRVSGKVIERLVDVGETVTKGQPLMRLDDIDLGLALRAKQNAVTSAKAALARSQADEQRFARLLASGAASHQLYDQAKQAYDTDVAQLDAAIADADFAKNESSYAVLVADSDGVITESLAEPGQVVSAGQTVVKLAHGGEREASVNLPETVRPVIGSAGLATMYGTNGAPIEAKLRQLSSAADPATRTFEARYVLKSENEVPLGSTIKVSIDLPGDESNSTAVDVPIGSVLDNGKQTGVWVVVAGKVSFEPVKILKIGDEDAVITGIDRGVTVVAVGVNLLNEGMAVRVADGRIASK
jgi:RND family efflux transporter MFP subunit